MLALVGVDPAWSGVLWSPVGMLALGAVLAAMAARGGLQAGLARGPAALQGAESAPAT